jgi:competence protein ComEA
MARTALVLLFSLGAAAQLPDEPGRQEVEKLCRNCHDVARSISPRQDRAAWNHTMTRMTAFGMKSTERDYSLALEYLAKHFPAEDVPRINVNKATAVELESALSLKRSQAAAVLAYRRQNGDFKSLDDLKKVPSIDAAKLDEKKDRITF